MKTLSVGDFKTHFSSVLEKLKGGEQFTIEFGKKHERVAVLLPYSQYKKSKKLKLGIMKHKGLIEFSSNYKMSEEEFLGVN